MPVVSPVSERLTVVCLLLLTFATGIVDAVSVGADQVICPCGKLIELEPEDPEPVEVSNLVYLPQLVAIDCPKCSAVYGWIGSWKISHCGNFDFGAALFNVEEARSTPVLVGSDSPPPPMAGQPVIAGPSRMSAVSRTRSALGSSP